MEFSERVKGITSAIAAVVGAIIAQVPEAVVALLLLMVLDVVTGMISASIQRRLSSEVSWQGLGRKTLTLLMVATAAVIEQYLPLDLPVSFTTAIALFYCAHEGLSIIENVVEAGVPVPRALRAALARIEERQDHEGTTM